MTEIIFYMYNDDVSIVNKKLDTLSKLSVQGDINKTFTNTDLSLIINNVDMALYNYCYIPSLKKYYFIDNITDIRNGIQTVNLKLDVLKTYENEIPLIKGKIIKSSKPTQYKQTLEMLDTYKNIDYEYNNPFNYDGENVLVTVTSKEVLK